MLSAVVAWRLVPIVGGFFAANAILWGFATIYASPQFATWYRDAAGISVAPEDPTIAYAGCRPGTYSAAYRITAARPIDLLFTLEDRNGIRAVDAGDLPGSAGRATGLCRRRHTLDRPSQLAWHAAGVYRAAAGGHVLLLHGAAPFQLGIFGAPPLGAESAFRHRALSAAVRRQPHLAGGHRRGTAAGAGGLS